MSRKKPGRLISFKTHFIMQTKLLLLLIVFTFVKINAQSVIITEIMADVLPLEPEPESEWIELYNNSEDTINLFGWSFRDAADNIVVIDENLELPPYEARVIANDSSYSHVLSYFQYGKKGNKGNISMNNGSEYVILNNGIEDVFMFQYDDGDYYGDGFSLELINIESAMDSIVRQSEMRSGGVDGTPNVYIPAIDNSSELPPIIITEILADAMPEMPEPQSEWIELYNTTNEPIDVRGYIIRDAALNQFSIDTNFIIPAYSARVMSNDSTVCLATSYFEYGLKGNKGNIAMNNGSEFVVLNDGINDIFVFSYNDGSHFGEGMTMELIHLDMAKDGVVTSEELRTPGMDGTPNFYSSTVPIRLKDYKAVLDKSAVHISWTSSAEINNDYYVLEYAFGNNYFDFLSKIRAAGNSYEDKAYSYIHHPDQSGIYYYRLKQYDFDGTSSELGVKAIRYIKDIEPYFDVQNLGHRTFNIENLNRDKILAVYIHNISGQKLMEFTLERNENRLMQLNFPTGIYSISFFNGENLVGSKTISLNQN